MSRLNIQHFGERLRRERLRHHLSQEHLAAAIGTSVMSINRWERGKALPQPHYRQELCRILGLSFDALFNPTTERGTTSSPQPILWGIPYHRNALFTGRDDILAQIYTAFHTQKQSTLSNIYALSGLGGIGKTSIVLEYAYHFRHQYGFVLWLQSETRDVLLDQNKTSAETISLLEAKQEQTCPIKTLQRWLNKHTNWLLILDQVEDIAAIEDIIPPESKGHTLITTRSQATGTFAQHIIIPPMEDNEGTLFLLRRAKYTTCPTDASSDEYNCGKTIVKTMGGLPLALDQAGSYLEETGCSCSDYLHHYQSERKHLLGLRGRGRTDHPQSIQATLSHSLLTVERSDPVAADLLRLLAFLHSYPISEELLRPGLVQLDQPLHTLATDTLAFDTAMAALRKHSLLHRDPHNKTVTIHPLVQAVLVDSMDESSQAHWREQAACLSSPP